MQSYANFVEKNSFLTTENWILIDANSNHFFPCFQYSAWCSYVDHRGKVHLVFWYHRTLRQNIYWKILVSLTVKPRKRMFSCVSDSTLTTSNEYKGNTYISHLSSMQRGSPKQNSLQYYSEAISVCKGIDSYWCAINIQNCFSILKKFLGMRQSSVKAERFFTYLTYLSI